MTKRLTIQLDFDDDDWDEFVNETAQGDVNAFVFGALCQNYDMGFLTDLKVETFSDGE